MYRRILMNSNAAINPADRGNLRFYFNEPINIQDDEDLVLEMRLSEAWFQLGGFHNFVVYIYLS